VTDQAGLEYFAGLVADYKTSGRPASPGLDPLRTEQGQRAMDQFFEGLSAAGSFENYMLRGNAAEQVQDSRDTSSFVGSFWSALGPEFVGMEPREGVEEYRRQNKVRGVISDWGGAIAPFVIPFAAKGALGIKLAAQIPKLAKVIKWASAAEHPVRAAAVKEAVALVPLEAARVATATGIGLATDDPGQGWRVAQHAAFDLGAFAAFGGAIQGVKGMRPFPRDLVKGEALVQEALPGFNLRWSPQEKLRALVAFKANPTPEALARIGEENLNGTISGLKRKVIGREAASERPGFGMREAYVKTITFGATAEPNGKAAAQALGNLFKIIPRAGARKNLRIKKLGIEGEVTGGLQSREVLDTIMERLALPQDWEAFALFPRLVQPSTDASAVSLRKTLHANMQRIDHQWFLAQQQNGMYVLAKRVKGRTLPKGAKAGEAKMGRADDLWLVLQTDRPGVFMPHAERFHDALASKAFQSTAVRAHNMDWKLMPSGKEMDELTRIAPMTSPLVGTEPSIVAKAITERLTPEARLAFQETHGLARHFSKKLKEFVGPALMQFSDSPRAQIIYQKARTMFNLAVVRTNREFYGALKTPKSKTLFGQGFERRGTPGSLDELISELSKQGLKDVNEAIAGNISVRDATEWASADALKLLRKLELTDQQKLKHLSAALRVRNEPAFDVLQNHYMVSRSWRGDHRVVLSNADGALVGVAAGKNRAQVKDHAEKIIAAVKEEKGIELHFDPNRITTWTHPESARQARKINLASEESAAIIQAQRGLVKKKQLAQQTERPERLGFSDDLSKRELKELVYQHMLETNRFMAQTALELGIEGEGRMLLKEFPELHRQLQDRIKRMAGHSSEFEQNLTRSVDKVMGPVLGANSASRIVRATNRGLFTLTLGMGDAGFVALNAMTPIQTAVPELAFLMSAPPARLAKYYTSSLVMGEKRIHTVEHLSPGKMLREAFKDMGNPSDELRAAYTRAQNEMVISPRFIEAFVGESSQTVMSLKKTLKGEQGYYDYIMRLSEYGPAKSEEFSRGLAYVMGNNVGRDFFRLKGDSLHKFASEFVGRTMYNYGTGDRPKIITGSIGTLFGLFKNWSMHYMANYMTYLGEGFLRNNWKPLLWQNAGTFAVAGVGAIPGYGMANAMSKALTDEPLMQHIYKQFNHIEPVVGDFASDRLSDAFFNGFPGLFGVTLQGRAAPPGAELVRDVNMLYSMMLWDRMTHAGRLGQAIDQAKSVGMNPIDSRKVTDEFSRTFLPRTWYRFIQTTAERGVRSLSTQNVLISPISIPERAAYVFGLTPTEIDKHYVIADDRFKSQARVRERISAYGVAIAEARRKGDWTEALRLHRQAMFEGWPVDSIERSATKREQNLTEPLIQRQFDDSVTRALKRDLRVGR